MGLGLALGVSTVLNEAGKSTLLKILIGTSRPTDGEVGMGGRAAVLLELGLGFHPDFSGRQNAMYGELGGGERPFPWGDDEPAQRQLFAFALRREGYCVLEARNGAEALFMVEQAGRVDLVVTDIVMPVMKGPELATRLRDRFPGVNVVFVSGFVVTEELGQNAHVMEKPFVRQDLLKRVHDLVGPPHPSTAA